MMRAVWSNPWEQALADECQRLHPDLPLLQALRAEAAERAQLAGRLTAMADSLTHPEALE